LQHRLFQDQPGRPGLLDPARVGYLVIAGQAHFRHQDGGQAAVEHLEEGARSGPAEHQVGRGIGPADVEEKGPGPVLHFEPPAERCGAILR